LTCEVAYNRVKEESEKDVKNVVFVGAVLLCGLLAIIIGFSVDELLFGEFRAHNAARISFSFLLFLMGIWSFALVWAVIGRNKKIAFQYSLYTMALLVVPCGFIFAPIVLLILALREKIIIYKKICNFP